MTDYPSKVKHRTALEWCDEVILMGWEGVRWYRRHLEGDIVSIDAEIEIHKEWISDLESKRKIAEAQRQLFEDAIRGLSR